MQSVVVPAAEADLPARAAAARLAGIGCEVGGVDLLGERGARKVILLWSRAAKRTPALMAAARRAKVRGKLVCVRLDAARPPSELGCAARLPRGRIEAAALRRLLHAKPRPKLAVDRPARAWTTTRRAVRRPVPRPEAKPADAARPRRVLASLAALVLILAAAGAEAYARDAAFAARLREIVDVARAQATEIAAEAAAN